MKKVLFLCTGNSCRSQMAEGWGKALHSQKYDFYSAGTKKHGMNGVAVEVMEESGVDLSEHFSKTLDELKDIQFDYVFTVCSDAHENCPYLPGVRTIHVGFEDPPRLSVGIEDRQEVLRIYRRVRDEIKNFVENIDNHLMD